MRRPVVASGVTEGASFCLAKRAIDLQASFGWFWRFKIPIQLIGDSWIHSLFFFCVFYFLVVKLFKTNSRGFESFLGFILHGSEQSCFADFFKCLTKKGISIGMILDVV